MRFLMDWASSQSPSTNMLDVDSSWIDSFHTINLDMSSSSTNDFTAMRDVLDEIANLMESGHHADQSISCDEKEIYEALSQAKGIKSMDAVKNGFLFPQPELELGWDFPTGKSAIMPEDSIFKVWDLNTEFEEGEFDKKLRMALTNTPPSVQQDALVIEIAEDYKPDFIFHEEDTEDLGILASVMADLSLNSNVTQK